jgi:trimeric autotransporter adhesin
MAGFKQRSLTLHKIESIPNDVDSNSIDIFYLNDGSIRAISSDGSYLRLDNNDSTLISVSGQLYSLIQTVSGDLTVYVNSISGSLDQKITNNDLNAVHKTGNESINGIKTFGDTTYFLNGVVIHGSIVDVETTELKVKDNLISLNYGVTGTPFLNAGIEVVRGNELNSLIQWNESLKYWTAGISGGLEKIIVQSDLTSIISNITGGNIASMQSQIIALSGQVVSISANYTPLSVTEAISANLQTQIVNINNNYTPLTTTLNVSGYLQTQIDDINSSFNNYYTSTEVNNITGHIYNDYTNADSNILSYITTISGDQKQYIDDNFVTLSTNQSIYGNKSFYNSNNQLVISSESNDLFDYSGISSINWNTRILNDGVGLQSIEWNLRELYDSSLNSVLSWQSRNLYQNWTIDSISLGSIQSSGAGNVLTWDASKTLIDSGININSLNSNVVQLSGYTNSNTNSINTLFSTYTNSSTTSAISAGLNTRLLSVENINTSQTNSINTLFSSYTNSSTTSSISAGLNSRLNSVENTNTSQTNSINTLFSSYTNSSTTSVISAGLQSQIDSINIVAGSNVTVVQNPSKTWTISSVGGSTGNSWLPTSGVGISITAPTTANYLFSVVDYIGKTEVSNISAGLNTSIQQISGYVQSNVVVDLQQTNSINTLFSTYTNSSTTSAISAGLNTRLLSVESINTSQTNSINTLFGTYTNSSTTSAISAGLNTRLLSAESINTVQTNSINTLFSTYTNSTTTANISAGLQSQIANLQTIDSQLISITGSFARDVDVVHLNGNETINGVKTFTSDISGDIDNTHLSIGVNNAQTIQIGGNNTNLINIAQGNTPTTINIGSAGDTVNVLGDLVYVKTTNSEVLNKTIIINASGAAGSSNFAGIYVQEGAISGAGFERIDNTRNSWGFKAPNRSGIIWLTPSSNNVIDNIVSSSTSNQTFNLQDKSGTIALLGDIPEYSSVVHTSGNESIFGTKNFFYPSSNISISTSGSLFYDIPNAKSIDYNSGIIYSNSVNSKSIDYLNRSLYGPTGFVTLDYNNNKLLDSSGYTSLDWGQRLSWYGNNSTVAINYSGLEVAINDISGNKAFSSNRMLLDQGLITTLNWNTKNLYGLWIANSGLIIGDDLPTQFDSVKLNGVVGSNIVIDTIATSSNEGASWKIVITDGTNKRITTVDSVFSNALIEYTEYGSLSIGNTDVVTMSCDIQSNMARLLASASSGTWTIKASRVNF